MLNIGDRVHPHSNFDFESYVGPANLDDVGTVVESDYEIGSPGAVLVEWDSSGEIWDHCLPEHSHEFAVVKVN